MTEKHPTRHIALLTEYDGTDFNGWQAQAKGRTVQQVLLKALKELTGENGLQLNGCSRTDSGVHAIGHVSHFRTDCRIPAEKLPLAINSRLPDDLAVRAASDVAQDFHAQYHALGKIYSYRLWHSISRPAYNRQHVCHVSGPIDLNLMRRALPYLMGRHNFQAFMDMGSCDRNPVRTIQSLTLTANGPLITLKVQGDGFLYHMVRILAGTLLSVAQGKLLPEDLPAILRDGNRKRAGKTMPPQGLCLEQVLYDPPLFTDYYEQMAEKGDNNDLFTME